MIEIKKEEFQYRIAITQQKMKEANIDVIIAFGNEAEPQYVRYYSDYWPSFETAAVVIPVEGEATLIIGPESMTYASNVSKVDRIRKVLSFRESSEPDYPGVKLDTVKSVINEATGKHTVHTIGIAGSCIVTQVVYEDIAAASIDFGAIIIKADLLVSKIRSHKSPDEIACMKEAYRISQLAMKDVIDNIKVGMTENQLKGIALKRILSEGGESEAYPFWILTGKDSNQAISRVRNKTIQEDDIVQIQVAARYKGYASTIGRPVVMGKATEEQRKLIEACYAVQKAILNTAKAGLSAKAISNLHYNLLKELGYEKYILYGPCHGTGLMEGEYPWIESNSDYVLEENMTFCTCCYLGNDEDRVGIRVEDGFIVTKEGTESMSNYRRELIEIK